MNKQCKEVTVDDVVVRSDVATHTANIFKIFAYEDLAIIYTLKGEPIRIRQVDLDQFIIDHTWGYYAGNYPSTKVTTNQIMSICEKYNLDFEAFAVNFHDSKVQQVVYLHRYLMGFYDSQKREAMKVTFKEVMQEYGLLSIDQLVVDHDTYNAREGGKTVNHYTDKMRIVPQRVNTAYRVGEAERNRQDIFPIVKDNTKGLFSLEIKESPSMVSKRIGVIIDSDALALNLTIIKKEINEKYSFYLKKVFERYGDIEHKRKAETELIEELIRIGKEMEQQGKVRVELFRENFE